MSASTVSDRPRVQHHQVRVPATSANLGAGFDAFGLAVTGLWLRARSVPRLDSAAARVTTVGEGAGELSTGDDNLLWRALVAFCERYDVPVPDVSVSVTLAAPLERGLGSSSSAIVAGLVLARALTGAQVGDRDLVELADELEGHPDNVAPALLGGLVACSRRDDGTLVVRRVNPTPRLRPVAIVPRTRQLTTAARAVLPETLGREAVADQAARAGHVLAALAGIWPADPGLAGDRLHEPPRLAAMQPSGRIVAVLRSAGVHAWLSGAGPTVLAMVAAAGRVPEAIAQVATEHEVDVHALEVDLSGAVTRTVEQDEPHPDEPLLDEPHL